MIRRIWKAVQYQKPAIRGIKRGRSLERDDFKADRIVTLLKSRSGASLRAIMELTGRQSHSVRGFISAQLAKRRGFKIQSFKRQGERIYRIRP